MSDFGQNSEFAELWRNNVCKRDLNKTLQRDRQTSQQMTETRASRVCNDVLSPRLSGSSSCRCSGLNTGGSPGDVEASQDIVWDSTSPTQTRYKNTQVVEISDIVNRLAPKGSGSSLSRWIDDGTIPCSLEARQKVKKKFPRQSNVEEDLKILARQIDENMQQDEESSEQLNFVNNDLCKTVNSSETKPTTASLLNNVKNLKCPSSSEQVEVQLYALFDCSTQGGSGRLSEGSSCSQEMVHQPVSAGLAKRQQTELKLAAESGTAGQTETCSNSAKNSEFYDDWNDDLLNDPFILAITQNPYGQDANPEMAPQPHTQTNTKLPSVLNSDSAHKPTDARCKTSSSARQELCPKPKSRNQNFTVIKHTSKGTAKNSAAPKMPTSRMSTVTNIQAEAPSIDDVSDGLWDDGDDELLYQICDSVERIFNSQPKEVNPNYREQKEETLHRQVETKKILPIGTTGSIHSGVSANSKRSSGAFVRSNSLPETSSKTIYQGWNLPMKGANNKSGMSESFPESRVNQGTFNHGRDFSGTFQAGNSNMDTHQRAFKRNMSDSAIISNKVFVTSQATRKCSATEIERKKQEALARRRQRMQKAANP